MRLFLCVPDIPTSCRGAVGHITGDISPKADGVIFVYDFSNTPAAIFSWRLFFWVGAGLRKSLFVLFALLFSCADVWALFVLLPPLPLSCVNGVPMQGNVVLDGAVCDAASEYLPQTCPPGEYCIAGVRYPCPAGTYSDTVAASSPDVCQSCPDGTYSTGGAYECLECAVVPCDSTTGNPIVSERLCEIGVGAIKTSTGLSFSLYAEKYTEPSLVVGYNDGKCYGKLEAGKATGTINFNYNGAVYHLVD